MKRGGEMTVTMLCFHCVRSLLHFWNCKTDWKCAYAST